MQKQMLNTTRLLLLSLVISLSLILGGCDTGDGDIDEGIGIEEGVGEDGLGEDGLDEEGLGEEED